MRTLLLTLLLVPMIGFGQNNYSMSFDGSSGIEGNSSGLDVSNNNLLTISAWVNLETYTPGTPQRIFTLTSFGSIYQQYAFNLNDEGKMYFLSGNGNFESNGQNLGNYVIPLNTWSFVTMTYDGSAVRLFIDGVLDFENFVSDIFPNDLHDFLYIGQRGDEAERFNGKIDDICVWNTALTQSEIQQYMNCPPTGTEAGLVGYWNFEEGSGTTALDLTSNGNDGTINGASYSTDVPVQNCCTPTSSIGTHTACNSFTWLDGTNYTASNNSATYTTINAEGCDSTITLDLTINSSSQSSFIVEGLDSYTSPSGDVYTTEGVYTDTIQNAAGCDSIITIDLSMNFTGIGELNNTPKQLIKIVDVLGRETPFKPNTPLLYIYNDGTVERKVVLK